MFEKHPFEFWYNKVDGVITSKKDLDTLIDCALHNQCHIDIDSRFIKVSHDGLGECNSGTEVFLYLPEVTCAGLLANDERAAK